MQPFKQKPAEILNKLYSYEVEILTSNLVKILNV